MKQEKRKPRVLSPRLPHSTPQPPAPPHPPPPNPPPPSPDPYIDTPPPCRPPPPRPLLGGPRHRAPSSEAPASTPPPLIHPLRCALPGTPRVSPDPVVASYHQAPACDPATYLWRLYMRVRLVPELPVLRKRKNPIPPPLVPNLPRSPAPGSTATTPPSPLIRRLSLPSPQPRPWRASHRRPPSPDTPLTAVAPAPTRLSPSKIASRRLLDLATPPRLHPSTRHRPASRRPSVAPPANLPARLHSQGAGEPPPAEGRKMTKNTLKLRTNFNLI
ncbi:vegetative cell wall protein gp1 [Triticum aestivum]|uniref:vegetative cell wall protein gp1 n=1 Tax=Triticum aestivum TaxID=4565 RepID=UPI001D0141F4|nr:vegetative cell wall protein gp1-like [Triticum aestivum]